MLADIGAYILLDDKTMARQAYEIQQSSQEHL